jgi:hypothetical protein
LFFSTKIGGIEAERFDAFGDCAYPERHIAILNADRVEIFKMPLYVERTDRLMPALGLHWPACGTCLRRLGAFWGGSGDAGE